jgi:hypothetical protein
MARLDIPRQRLHNQGITRATFEKPSDVVDWLAAVQAQDYAGAKWALGLRSQEATDDEVERAFNEGAILRTHLLRPTWHFVTPADIHWLLALTAPRVHAVNASMYRRLELDSATFKRSHAALAKALHGGQRLTRDELRGVLHKAGIAADSGLRMGYLLMRAELDGIVCSGGRRGKQFTYALLDERAPHAKMLKREEALAELARRYYLSRGPATVQDFAKWSGLTIADARHGLEAVKAQLQHKVVDGQSYWFSTSRPTRKAVSPSAYLLSIYDEYISGYQDRGAIIDARHAARLWTMGNALSYIIVVDGQVVGTWKRTLRKDAVVIETNIFARLTKAERRAVAVAADQVGAFLELPVVLV